MDQEENHSTQPTKSNGQEDPPQSAIIEPESDFGAAQDVHAAASLAQDEELFFDSLAEELEPTPESEQQKTLNDKILEEEMDNVAQELIDTAATTGHTYTNPYGQTLPGTEDIEMAANSSGAAASVMQVDKSGPVESEQEELSATQNLIKIAEEIVKIVNEKREPFEIIKNYNHLLQVHSEEVISHIKATEDKEVREKVIDVLFHQVSLVFLAERVIQKEKYLIGIFGFFEKILVFYLPSLFDEFAVFKVISEILNTNQTLYQALGSQSITGSVYYDANKQLVKMLNEQEYGQIEMDKIAESQTWRESLKPGDIIDAVNSFNTPNSNQYKFVSGWAPAKVTDLNEEGELSLSFPGNSRDDDQVVSLFESNKIAPYRTYTDDWEWRLEVQPDDHIDCCDDYGIWYKSMVIQVLEDEHELDIDGLPIKQAVVGFRFLDKNGMKEDSQKRKVTGWCMSKYDLRINLAGINIKRYNTMSTQYFNVGAQHMRYDLEITDMGDPIYHSTKIEQYTIHRKTHFANIKLVAHYINEFGKRAGFDKVIDFFDRIGDGSLETTLEHIQSVVEFLLRVLPLFTREFSCVYTQRVSQAFQRALRCPKACNPLLKQTNKDQTGLIIQNYQLLLRRYYVAKRYHQICNYLNTQISSILLGAQKLEQRIQGIKMVTDQIRHARRHENKTSHELIEDLKSLNIFQCVFASSKFHLQIVQRSSDLLRIFAFCQALGKPEVEMLWEASRMDETAKNEIYKIITETNNDMHEDCVEALIIKVKELDASLVQAQDVKFIYEIGSGASYKSQAAETLASALWQIATLDKPGYSKALLKPARKNLTDLIRTETSTIKESYICLCIERLSDENVCSVQTIKILKSILSKLPKFHSMMQQKEFVKDLIRHQDIITLLVKDLQVYMVKARALWQKKGQAGGIFDASTIHNFPMFEEGFTHAENVEARLKTIVFVLDCCDREIALESTNLEQIWDILMGEQSFPGDKESFFDWLRQILSNGGWCDTKLVAKLFEERILKNQKIVEGIQMNGFACIQMMFLSVNELKNNLSITQRSKDSGFSKPSITTSSNFAPAPFYNSSQTNKMKQTQLDFGQALKGSNKDSSPSKTVAMRTKNKLEFRVHVKPEQLEGIEIIWQMFQHSDHRDTSLQEGIIHFLALIYQSTSRLLEQYPKREIYQFFISECLTRMNAVVNDQTQSKRIKSDLVKNTMTMLQAFFEDTEKKGTANIKPHLAIEEEPGYIEEIIISSYIAQESCPKHMVLSVNSSMTVWELIDFIAKKYKRSPLKLMLRRDAKRPAITPYDYCKSLKQLGFESHEEINVLRQPKATNKVPLVNPQTNTLVPEAEAIFGGWFDSYSVESEAGDPEPRYMTRESCIDFLCAAVSEQASRIAPKITLDDKRIATLFENYDSDKDDRLTKADFIRFYCDNANDNSDRVWMNLGSHEIGKDLLPEPKIEANYFNDSNVIRDQRELPRYLLSSDTAQLEMLFALEQQFEDSRVKSSIWNLISSAKTNIQLYLALLQNENLDQTIGKPGEVSIYKLMFCLQILKSFFGHYGQQKQNKVKLYYEKGLQPLAPKAENNPDAEQTNSAYNEAFPNIQSSHLGYPKGTGQDGESAPPLETVNEHETYRNLGGDHWNEPPAKIAPEGVAIPLPGPETIDTTTTLPTNDQDKSKKEAEVPEKSKEEKQMTYIQKQVANWRGDLKQEEIDLSLFKPEEIAEYMNVTDEEMPTLSAIVDYTNLKEQWLPNFIQSGGFDYLVSIISTLATKYQNSSAQETLQNDAEKLCVKMATHMIKIILMSSFCASSDDKELVGSLQRKLSIAEEDDENAKKEDKVKDQGKDEKSKIQTHQDEVAQEFMPLIELLREDQSGLELIKSIDFAKFQQLLQLVFEMVLRRKGLINQEDRAIVAEGLKIWISCVTYNSEWLKRVYQVEDFRNRFISTFIDQGILGESENLRNQFRDSLLFVCLNVKQQDLAEAPVFFFLRILIAKLDQVEKFRSTQTLQYFDLMKQLLAQYFKLENEAPFAFVKIFEPAQFTKKSLGQLISYQSKEAKASSIVDHTLVGFIKLVKGLLLAHPGVLSQAESATVLTMLVQKCLFNQGGDAFEGHITEQVNLKEHSARQINKCHTTKSRSAAYKLFQIITGSNPDPKTLQTVLIHYWLPLIAKIAKPKEYGFNPQEHDRSSYGFAGIKNLGCICYMNSMIQQLFNVPTFRYSLLAADDQKEAHMVEHDGRQIDDNSLHQWVRMFSFLAMTDRQEYNPFDFCFAFKQQGGEPTNVRVQQDAQEFLNFGFDRLESMLKNTPMKYLCQNVFQGQNTNMTICKDCGNINQTDEDFYCLTVNIKNKKTLSESLEGLVAGEVIPDYKCEACGKRVEIEKKLAIKKLPNTLIVHLNRIVFDFDKFRNIKLNDKLEFPNTLDLKQFCLEQVLKQTAKLSKERSQAKEMQDEEQAVNMQQEHQPEDAKDNEEEDHEMVGEAQQINTGGDVQEQIGETDMNALLDVLEEDEEMQADDSASFEYKLVGVVIHMGVAEAGHYLSYINIEREGDSMSDPKHWVQTDKQTWLEFNDSLVQPFDFDKMQHKCFGENEDAVSDVSSYEKSHNAYMLVYEKREKSNMKIPLDLSLIKQVQQDQRLANLTPQQITSAALGCDSTAVSRVESANQNQIQTDDQDISDSPTDINSQSSTDLVNSLLSDLPHTFRVFPELLSLVHQNQGISYDATAKEHYIEVPYHSARKFIPSEYYKDVHYDNQVFLAEKQVLCNPFFKTTASLLEQVIKHTRESLDAALDGQEQAGVPELEERYFEIFKILDKLVFDMLVYSTELKHLKEITGLLFEVLERSPRAMLLLVQERILQIIEKPDKKDDKNYKPEKPFFDMLIFHREQEVREMVSQILIKVTAQIFDQLDNDDGLEMDSKLQMMEFRGKIIDYALALMPIEVQKAWMKLDPYFDFFYSLVKDRKRSRIEYLINTNVLQRFIDLLTKYPGQQVYQNMQPPFEKLVLTVCTIARSVPRVSYLFRMESQYQLSYDENLKEITDHGLSPFYLEPVDSEEGNPYLFMNADDLYSLFMDSKRLKTFYKIVLGYHSEHNELAQLIGHLSWQNEEMSRRLAKVILVGLNKVNADELPPFVSAMKVFLSIEDQYQQQRIEWLLGVPELQFIRPSNAIYRNDYSFEVQKIGGNKITDIEECICDYRTTLCKEPSQVKESLLQMMYAYRKDKFQRAMIALTEGLFSTMVTHNKNLSILKYLLTIEPPAYSSCRYWDWIEPHVISQIELCTESSYSQSSRGDLENWLKINQNIQILRERHPNIFKLDDPEVTQGVGGRPVPEPYLMWDIVSHNEYDLKRNTEKMVDVVVTELMVNVSRSKPNGTTNECLTKCVRGMSTVMKQNKTAKKVTVKNPRRQRGQRAREYKIAGSGAAGRGRGSTKSKKDTSKWPKTFNPAWSDSESDDEIAERQEDVNMDDNGFLESDAKDGAMDEPEPLPAENEVPVEATESTYDQAPIDIDSVAIDISPEDEARLPTVDAVGQQDGSQPQDEKNPLLQDDNDGDNIWIEDTDIKNESGQNTPPAQAEPATFVTEPDRKEGGEDVMEDQDGLRDKNDHTFGEPQFSDGFNVDENMEFDVTAAHVGGQATEQQTDTNLQQDQDEEGDQLDQDQDEEVEEETFDDDMQQEMMPILVFMIRNFNRQKKQTITIRFPQNVAAQCNFRVPSTDLIYSVPTQTDKTAFKFTKLKPMADWGPVKDFNVIIDDLDLDGNQCSTLSSNFPHLRVARVPLIEAAQKAQEDAEMQAAAQQDVHNDFDAFGSSHNAGTTGGDATEVQCPQCTLNNPVNATHCEVCDYAFG